MRPAAAIILTAGAAYGAWWLYNKTVAPVVGAGQAVADAAGGAAAIVASGVANLPTIAAEDVGIVVNPLDAILQPATTLINGAPRGIRDNNPCNVLYCFTPYCMTPANAWQGLTGADTAIIGGKVFCIFSDPVWGIRAAMKVLIAFAGRGITDLSTICRTWVYGASGGGVDGTGNLLSDAQGYINTVSAVSGLGPSDQLDTSDETSMIDFVTGLIAAENGQQYATYYTYMQMASAWSAI